jgi:hypothetical protein
METQKLRKKTCTEREREREHPSGHHGDLRWQRFENINVWNSLSQDRENVFTANIYVNLTRLGESTKAMQFKIKENGKRKRRKVEE